MDWDLLDFAVFGAMVSGVVLLAWLARRKSRSSAYRFAVGVALAAAFLLLWVNGAVGIIGDEGNDANLMYIGVLATGLVGALIARFRPQGMSRAMLATAAAQAAVAAIAVTGDLGATASAWPGDVLILTAFFVLLWLLAAWLFKRSARRHYAGELELRG
jgi:hypothetical protein